MWKNYILANSIEHALELINSPTTLPCKLIAGATDLMLELERGLHPNLLTLVDVSRIENLKRISMDGKGFIHLGALVTHNDCVASPLLRQFALPLVLAAWEVGSPQIRNRGTIVGNLVTGSPANDTITPLMALDASLVVRSVNSIRIIPLLDFYKGVRSTLLESNEMVIEVIFRGLTNNQKGMYIKHALRKAQAISVVNTAVILEMDGDRINRASITLGAVASTIIHAQLAEKSLVGQTLNEEIIEQAGKLAAQECRPISDLRGSANYRRWMVRVNVKRALEAILNKTDESKLPANPPLLSIKPPEQHQEWHENEIQTRINGQIYRFHNVEAKSLLDLLRENVGLTGTKEGCSEGECGACTVHMDGMAVMSCLVPAPQADGAEILTIEGLAPDNTLHPIQTAFIQTGAVQCGYCTPGLIMSSAKLLEEIPKPDHNQIINALTGNLCRCTGYYKIIEAVERVVSGG